MRINSISLNNFRIYKGEHKLSFSPSSGKNIYIVAGENGFGKTTLLTSLVWCLYGKLMTDVDEKFKQEISAAFGYKNFAKSNLNKQLFKKSQLFNISETELKSIKKKGFSSAGKKGNDYSETTVYSVTVVFSDVVLPSVPCEFITIKRTFDVLTEKEDVSILIDGKESELTKEVGPEIFINDFILSREIAKFFFFDSEKIVALAEMKTNEDKKKLSKAYSEVLGIKKYEDLKNNLENLRIKFRRKSSDLAGRDKLNKLLKEAEDLQKIINHLSSQIINNDVEILNKRQMSEQYQEKLIREGNGITVEELLKLKKLRDELKEKETQIRTKLKELLELAPFAIMGERFFEAYTQVKQEKKHKEGNLNFALLNKKLLEIQGELSERVNEKNMSHKTKTILSELIKETFHHNLAKQHDSPEGIPIYLDLSNSEESEFMSIFENVKYSYSLLFKQVVKDDKNNRIFLGKTTKKISQAESNENDLLVKEIRSTKNKIDKALTTLEKENRKISEEIGSYQRDLAIKHKLIAELSKTVSVDDSDKQKDQVAERIIRKLDLFLNHLKTEKKANLEVNIKHELNRLMHKREFVDRVTVEILNDIIDIKLYDYENLEIKKENLSKGEQQLYATAILKALVDESEIKFPVFIDSPLQKFDKKHSNKIISEFYPSVSKQVVLFPLIEKELSKEEYDGMLPYVQDSFIIRNNRNLSYFESVEPNNLFIKAAQAYV